MAIAVANTLAYAQVFMQELDRQLVAGATSGWMENNAGQVIYTGGNTIKVPKISMDGMGNYNRTTGFVSGQSTLAYETLTLGQDRGRAFSIDENDVDETNFVENASNLMGEFQRTMVIPEIDAYRYSKIASLAIAAGRSLGGYTPGVADILTKLRSDIASIQDVIGAVPLVVTMSIKNHNILEQSTELVKQLQVGTMQANLDLTYNVSLVDECPIVEVPSARLMTSYVMNDGVTAGQTQGGFVASGTAKHINWIISAQTTPIAISKTDNMRIFDPQTNQVSDSWLLQYRKYHELWIMDNKMPSIWVNTLEV
jgi:hypothetical protein